VTLNSFIGRHAPEPETVVVDETAYVETSFSYFLYRSRRLGGVTYGRGASAYLGTKFDVGPNGTVTLGEYAPRFSATKERGQRHSSAGECEG
jgi:hypothetical protein